MFIPDKTFKEIILDSLKNEDRSISSLHRLLKEEGYDIHRLILTGYLRAMEDLNVVKAKDIPPSKVYSAPTTTDMDIYETIGSYCADLDMINDDKAAFMVYSFQKLFRRPVFLEELERSGIGPNLGNNVKKISSEERTEIKKVLNKRGIKTRYNDPAYRSVKPYDDELNEMILHFIINKFSASNLVIDTKQTKLGV